MSFELRRRPKQSLAVGSDAWSFLLMLAEEYGWRPAGTALPAKTRRRKGWDGGYSSADGQKVEDGDALAFAAALDRATADRAYRRRVRAVRARLSRAVREAALRQFGIALPLDFDDEEGVSKTDVKQVADFCRQGAFTIH